MVKESGCSELVRVRPHCREFCVMCCITSRIACGSAENIEKEDGGTMVYSRKG